MKNLIVILILIFTLTALESNAQYAKSKIPHYLYQEYEKHYLDNDYIPNPLIKRVMHKPAPAEWAKYKPSTTRIMNGDGFELINITNGNDAQSETWIAINPKNPNNLIATANDNKYLGGYQNWRMSSWISFDGGQTWKHSTTPANIGIYIDYPQSGSMTIFDPGVAFDTDGNAVYTYGFTQVTSNQLEGENGVFAVMSTNGGTSWDGWGEDLPISPIALSSNETSSPFHDRYTTACDNVSNTEYRNNFYCTWQRFVSKAGVSFSYSEDKGESWSSPMLLSNAPSTQAPMPAVGPDGEVYVAWISSNYQTEEASAVVIKSTNGGKNWGNSITAQKVYSIGTRNATSGRFTFTNKQGMRVSSPPQIAVDASSKPSRGYVYVVQAGRETAQGKYGVWISRSTNGGQIWKKVRIDNNEERNDMFFPSITVDPITGTIAVLYYSSQNDSEKNQGIDAYLSISNDGGDTWSQIRLTPTSWFLNEQSDVMPQGEDGNIYWGDYTSITSYNGVIYPLFWMPTATTGNYWSLDLFTAPISNNPKPVKDLLADNVVAENVKIKLSWTNPTFDLLNNVLTNFDVLIYKDNGTTPIATINKSNNPEYFDSDVVDGKTYTYTLKVKTPEGRESTPVSTSILAGGALKPLPPTAISWNPEGSKINLFWTNPEKAIDGTDIRDLSKINIYIDGSLNKTFDMQANQTGAFVSASIDLADRYGKLTLSAVATRGGKSEESNLTEPIVVFAGPVYTKYSENFDGEISMPFFAENSWIITNAKAQSPQNALVSNSDSKYLTNANYTMILPPVIITAENQSLLFDQICLVHNTDVAEVSVSNDWGNTFKGISWYNIATSSNFIRNDLENSKWLSTAADLRSFIGDTVVIKFSLYSGSALTDLGWYVDNINMDNSVNVKSNSIEANSIAIYPNPAINNAEISMKLNTNTPVNIQIFDMLGNEIRTFDQINFENAAFAFNMDLTNIPTGMYIVKVNSNNECYIKTLIIQ